MFDEASNVQLPGILLKANYPKLTVMRGVEHTVSLLFNSVSKIPNMVYNIFGSAIYHKPRSILKSKCQEFYNINIGIFSGNDTRMAVYFM